MVQKKKLKNLHHKVNKMTQKLMFFSDVHFLAWDIVHPLQRCWCYNLYLVHV